MQEEKLRESVNLLMLNNTNMNIIKKNQLELFSNSENFITEKLLNECSSTNFLLKNKNCAFCEHMFNCSCMDFSLKKTLYSYTLLRKTTKL